MYNLNQYTKDTNRRARIQQEVKQIHFADEMQANQKTASANTLHIGHKLTVTIALVIVVILFLLLAPQRISASDKFDSGDADAFYDQMMAYRLGHYYYVTGDYERAVDYYNQAIEGIPEAVLAQVSSFRDLYWYRGDAQLKSEQLDAALDSYQYYLKLAGDEAVEVEINFVQALQTNIATGNVTMEPLES